MHCIAGMAELADAPDLGSGVFDVQVQVLLPAPLKRVRTQLASGLFSFAKIKMYFSEIALFYAKALFGSSIAIPMELSSDITFVMSDA